MRTNGEFDREIDARRNNTAPRTVASRNLAGKPGLSRRTFIIGVNKSSEG